MIRRFCSGSVTPARRVEEPLPGVHHHEVHAEVRLKRHPQELRLLLAHEPVVHVDAGQPVTDGAMYEGCRNRRIDATRQRADDLAVRARLARVLVDPLADLDDGGLDEVCGCPGGRDPGDARDEVAQDILAPGRVRDLGVELDAVQIPVRRRQARVGRRLGLGGRVETVRESRDGVAVAHPHRLLAVDSGKQPVVLGDLDGGGAVLTLRRRHHVAAEFEGHELRAVADAQDRQAACPDRVIRLWRRRVVHGVGAAREDDRPDATCLELCERRVVGQQLRVDVELPDAPCDQLGELRAEVQDRHDARLGNGRGDRRRIRWGARWGRRVQGDLEIGLDLRVIGSEHAMAGVGQVPVDGLAALDAGLRCPLLVLRLGQWPLPRAGLDVWRCSLPARAAGSMRAGATVRRFKRQRSGWQLEPSAVQRTVCKHVARERSQSWEPSPRPLHGGEPPWPSH